LQWQMPAPKDASMRESALSPREGVFSVRAALPRTAFLTDVSAREMSVVEVSRLARVPVVGTKAVNDSLKFANQFA
jgi:hypothetical protein